MPYSLLKQKNSYFQNLSPDAQELFLARVFKFMESKNFIGREGLVITDEIRILISASAVQLTFGLRDYIISHLHTINVFPHVFYSKLFETHFKGLNTQGGILSLSWSDFKEGYSNEHDKINLGLHELAHALNIDLDEDGNFDEHFSDSFEKWKKVAVDYFLKLKAGEITFLRSYGGTNMHEFFAVCIEHFFELPNEFKKQLPQLYWVTAYMLNQDPDNAGENYQLKDLSAQEHQTYKTDVKRELSLRSIADAQRDTDTTKKESIERFIRIKGVNIAMASTFVGLFIGIPILIWFSSVTIIDVGTIFLLIFLCGGIGLLQWRFVRDHIDMHYHQFAMYAFSGFGMCFINFLLFLNLFISIGGKTETYDLGPIYIDQRKLDVRVGESESSPFARNLTNFLQSHFHEVPKEATKITVVYSKGLLGFDKISDVKFN